MNDMMNAFKKAAVKNPELRKILDETEANNKLREEQRKKNKAKAEKEKQEKMMNMKSERASENMKKKIYVWRSRVHGMHYSVRSGFVFAENLDEAKKLVQDTYGKDEITFIDEADTSESVVETCMYIE